MSNAPRRAGRHFLQIPGPTPVPDRILRAMDMPVIDHRGPEFKVLGLKVLAGIKTIFKTASPVFIYPSSGTGAWEAALVNTLSPGDKVLMYETGHFATLWKSMATQARPRSRSSSPRTGAAAPTPRPSRRGCARTRGTPSRPCASSTTRPPRAPPRASTRCAAPSTRPGIRRCSWSTPSPRSPRSTTATTSGASTSRSAARRRA